MFIKNTIDLINEIINKIKSQFLRKNDVEEDSCYFFQYPRPTEQQKYIYKKLKPGDIVMAHIPIPDIECDRLGIHKNHRIRPYILIDCMNRGFYGVPATSNHKFKYNPECFPYFDANNKLHHISYFLIFNYEYVPLCNLVQKLCTLETHEKECLQQRLINYRNKGNEVTLLQSVATTFPVGSIFETPEHSKWYIYSIWKNTFYLHPVYNETHKGGQPVRYLNRKTCFVDITEQKTSNLSALQGCIPLWFCSIKTVERLQGMKKKKTKK